MLSGCRFWLVSVLDHFLSGLAPGRFAKIHKFYPDRDQAFAGITGVLESFEGSRVAAVWQLELEQAPGKTKPER